ncbi:MAG: hypothetical protein ABI335_03300 [Polyangiaceae bacterium]
MGLLHGKGFHARAMLGFRASFLKFAVADGFEARGLFFAALLFGAASLFFGSEATLFGVAGGPLGAGFGFSLGARDGLFVGLFFFDPILFQAHQFFEREENRAFLLFGHIRVSLNPSRRVGASRYTTRIPIR